jgi:hypothetical protein
MSDARATTTQQMPIRAFHTSSPGWQLATTTPSSLQLPAEYSKNLVLIQANSVLPGSFVCQPNVTA